MTEKMALRMPLRTVGEWCQALRSRSRFHSTRQEHGLPMLQIKEQKKRHRAAGFWPRRSLRELQRPLGGPPWIPVLRPPPRHDPQTAVECACEVQRVPVLQWRVSRTCQLLPPLASGLTPVQMPVEMPSGMPAVGVVPMPVGPTCWHAAAT